MKAISHALATEVLEIAAANGGRLQWDTVPEGVVLEAEPESPEAGAIAAARTIEAETCGECRGPGRPYSSGPNQAVRTRCARCAAPDEVPAETRWSAPAVAIMTPSEAAEDGWMHPETLRRLRCCGWDVERTTRLMNHDDSDAGIEGQHGWNHLARALLRLVMTNQGTDGWRLVGLEENWGRINAGSEPENDWRDGALTLFRKVSGKTCSRCGRPGAMRDHCNEQFDFRPLCDDCEAQWRADEQTPDDHLRRPVLDEATRKGQDVNVDAEIARLNRTTAEEH